MKKHTMKIAVIIVVVCISIQVLEPTTIENTNEGPDFALTQRESSKRYFSGHFVDAADPDWPFDIYIGAGSYHYYYAESVGEVKNEGWASGWNDFNFELVDYTLQTSVEETATPEYPVSFHLLQNYPNPFNPVTNISYQIPASGWISIRVYDLIGKQVTTLADQFMKPGEHTIQWDATGVSSGVYLLRIVSGQTDLSEAGKKTYKSNF